jgi:hypothetical protein
MDKLTFRELSAQYNTALITLLFPLPMAEDIAEYEAMYRKQFGIDRWRKRRSVLAPKVDALIIEILTSGYTTDQVISLLRKTQNETLLFYFERLMSVRCLLAEFEKSGPENIIVFESRNELWIDLFVNKVKLVW